MASEGNSDIDLTVLSQRLDSINRVVRQTAAAKKDSPAAQTTADTASADANTIATAISSKEDSNGAASEVAESKSPAIDELTLEDDEAKPDEDRNKRWVDVHLMNRLVLIVHVESTNLET